MPAYYAKGVFEVTEANPVRLDDDGNKSPTGTHILSVFDKQSYVGVTFDTGWQSFLQDFPGTCGTVIWHCIDFRTTETHVRLIEKLCNRFGYTQLLVTLTHRATPTVIDMLKNMGWTEGHSFRNRRSGNVVVLLARDLSNA